MATPQTKPNKAIVAGFSGATALLGSLIIAVTAGSDGGATVTMPEWLQAAWVTLSAVGGVIGVYGVTNQSKGS